MRAVITSIFLSLLLLYSGELFSQSHLDFDVSNSNSISPNLGLSEDTVKLELSIVNPNGSILFFRSHSYDYFSVTDNLGRVILSDEDYQKGIQHFKLADTLEHQDFQIRILSGEQILLPIVVSDETTILNDNRIKDDFYLFFAGIFVSIILYNLFLFVSLGDVLYLIYVIATIFIGLVQLHFGGKLTEWFYDRQSIFAVYDTQILGALSGVSTIVFANSFLHTKRYCNWVYKISLLSIFLYSLSLILLCFSLPTVSYQIINLNASVSLLLVVASVYAIRGGNRQARFFLFAWSFFLIGVTVFALKDFGILPFNAFTNFALPVGSVVEILLLSFALADRINVLKQEKELSQQQAFVAMKENERLVTEQNIQLEKKVHERTSDLENRNTELHTAMNDLRMTQQQLVESEKLASIGQMTAGIAHEINNPINFVQSNVGPLKRDIDEILDLLSQLAQIDENKDLLEQVNHLKSQYIKLDVDYLKKEIEQLLNGIEDGSKRTAEIVKGLRVFSRMDRNELVSADINECLHSTLVVMKNMTKAEVTLNVELGENIPKIKCYPGKLSQVFMNLVTNAVQATRLPGRQPIDRVINVRSFLSENKICVEIQDNGNGIPMEIQEKIFEPFFTTKDVGEGTGLGLSIVAGIVGEHNGQLTFTSKANEGTTFLITLPTDSKNQ
jgi:signal transduction histidine kinase